MGSITSFLRNAGYPVREIKRLVQQLRPNSALAGLEVGAGGGIEDVFRQMVSEPEVSQLLKSRDSLSELGIVPEACTGHTLTVPIASKDGMPDTLLYFARVSEDQWVYFADRPTEPGHTADAPPS